MGASPLAYLSTKVIANLIDAETLLNLKVDRRDVYQRLSACFHLPDAGIVDSLDGLAHSIGGVCPEAVEDVTRMREQSDIERLRIDFSSLFVGPYQLLAPPYGSVYLEGERRVMGDSTMDAMKRYREAGLVISQDMLEAPDHIAIELEFVYFLACGETACLSVADLAGAAAKEQEQRAFLQDHLGAWVGPFATQMERGAATEFYRCLARATRAFVEADAESIAAAPITGLHVAGAAP